MTIRANTYDVISRRLEDWLNTIGGGSVSNLPLDLLNRAQDWLGTYKPWDGLVKRAELTLSNGRAVLPADWVMTLAVFNADDSGYPTQYYYRDARQVGGYRVVSSFDKDTGHVVEYEFFDAPSGPVYLLYQMDLGDFVGSGTEYSFYPGELLLAIAQKIHIEETGLSGGETQVLLRKAEEQLDNYVKHHMYQNGEMRMRMNDWYGNEVAAESYSLGMGASRSPGYPQVSRSYLP